MAENTETMLAALVRDAKATTSTQRAVLDIVHQHTRALNEVLAHVKAEPEGKGLQKLAEAMDRLSDSIDRQSTELKALRAAQSAFQTALTQQIGAAVATGIDLAVNNTGLLQDWEGQEEKEGGRTMLTIRMIRGQSKNLAAYFSGWDEGMSSVTPRLLLAMAGSAGPAVRWRERLPLSVSGTWTGVAPAWPELSPAEWRGGPRP